MKTLKLTGLLCFVLASSMWAKVPVKGNSSYGNAVPTVDSCLDANGNPLGGSPDPLGICSGAPVGSQMFAASSPSSDYMVFDYKINGFDSYSLEIENTANPFVDFGFYTIPESDAADCTGGGTSKITGILVYCGADPSTFAQVPSIDPTDPTRDPVSPNFLNPPVSDVTFTIPAQGDGLVFFVLEDGTFSTDSNGDPVFTPASTPRIKLSTTVPEPGSLVLLTSVILLLVHLGRRRWRATF